MEPSADKTRHLIILSITPTKRNSSQNVINNQPYQHKLPNRSTATPFPRKQTTPGPRLPKYRRSARVLKFMRDSEKMKEVYRWMWLNDTRTTKGHEAEFKLFLEKLGFTDSSITPQGRKLLRTAVEEQIWFNAGCLKKWGAYTLVPDGKKKTKKVQYAEWTEAWVSERWDGDPSPPSWTQVLFDPYWGEARELLRKNDSVVFDEASDSLLVQESLMVEEAEAVNEPRSAPNIPRDSESAGEDQDIPEAQITSFSQFNFLARAHVAVSIPGYRVDVAELPQYHGVQLTPCLKSHPMHPDPLYLPGGSNYWGNEMYDDDEYDDDDEFEYEDYEDYEDCEGVEQYEDRGE